MCSPCIQNVLQNAVRECISRVFCHQDALFPSESLKSCAMGKYCHAFAIPPFARGPARDQCCDLSLTEVVACPYVKVRALWLDLHWGTSVVARPSLGHQRCGSSLMWRCDRRVRPLYGGASVVARPLCGNASAATRKSRAAERRLPGRDLAAMHS